MSVQRGQWRLPWCIYAVTGAHETTGMCAGTPTVRAELLKPLISQPDDGQNGLHGASVQWSRRILSRRYAFVGSMVFALFTAVFVLSHMHSTYTYHLNMANVPQIGTGLRSVSGAEQTQSGAARPGYTSPAPWSPAPTSPAPWSPGTTLRAADGRNESSYFRQMSHISVLVQQGDNVALNCRLVPLPLPVVSWNRIKNGTETYMSMGHRIYINDTRLSIQVNDSNWALRIQRVSLEDAGDYFCQVEFPTEQHRIQISLDVKPLSGFDIWSGLPMIGDVSVEGFQVAPPACQDSAVRLLVFVTSHPLYRTARDRIRASWGRLLLSGSGLQLVFGVGTVGGSVTQQLQQEMETSGDLVQGRFTDSAQDTQLLDVWKLLNALHYQQLHCRHADFLLYLPHSCFLNPTRLLQLLRGIRAEDPAMYGSVVESGPADRDPTRPQYLPYRWYRGGALPRYLSGPVYLMSGSTVAPLLAHLPGLPAIRQPNLLVTGLAAEAAHVPRLPLPDLYTAQPVRVEDCEYTRYAVTSSWGRLLDIKVSDQLLRNHTCRHG